MDWMWGVKEREDSTRLPSFPEGASGWLVMPFAEVRGGVEGRGGFEEEHQDLALGKLELLKRQPSGDIQLQLEM